MKVLMNVLFLPYSDQSAILAQARKGLVPDNTLMGISHLPDYGINVDILDPPNPAWTGGLFRRLRGRTRLGSHIERNFLQLITSMARRHQYDCVLLGSKENVISDGVIRLPLPIRRPPVIGLDVQISRSLPFPALIRLLVSKADGLAVLSRHIAEDLIALGFPREKVHVLAYGVDDGFFRPRPEKTEPDIEVLSLGHACRDFSTLLRAVNGTYVTKIVSWGVSLPGGGEQSFSELERLCSGFSNVGLTSRDYGAIRGLYSRSLTVVVPLLSTDLCAGITTVLEAMAMGIAPIVTWNRNIVEYVQDWENGLIVRPNDPKDLREKIQFLMDNPSVARDMGKAARKTVEQKFTTRREAQTLSRIIMQVVTAAA